MSQFVSSRENAARSICRISAFVKSSAAEKADLEIIEIKVKLLESQWEKFCDHHEEVLKVTGEAALQEQLAIFEPTEEVYVHTAAQLNRLLKRKSIPPIVPPVSPPVARTSHEDSHLPKIELPKFSTGYIEWQSFADLFTALVHNHPTLTNVEKLQYLKSSVTGEAESLLSNITITDINYELAWNTLKERFTNLRVITGVLLSRLFTQPIASDTADEIKALHDTTSQALQMLSNLGRPTQHWDDVIVYLVTQRLGPDSRRLWETKISSKAGPSTWPELQDFLRGRFRTLEATSSNSDTIHDTRTTQTSPRSTKATPSSSRAVQNTPKHSKSTMHARVMATNSLTTSSPVSHKKCDICHGYHRHFKCAELINMSVKQRLDRAVQHQWCLNCLQAGHNPNSCPSSMRCLKCHKPHHSMLHQNNSDPDDNKLVNTISQATSTTLLATALVQARSTNGTLFKFRALIDPGSEISIITERAAQLLQLCRRHTHVSINSIGRNSVPTRGVCSLRLKSLISTEGVTLNVFILAFIADCLPARKIDIPSQQLEVPLADPEWYEPRAIDILIGADIYPRIIKEGIRYYDRCIAQNSVFGWLLSGQVTPKTSQQQSSLRSLHMILSDPQIDNMLRQLWEIADAEKENEAASTKAIDHFFSSTYERLPNGRIQVRLPFESNIAKLGDSLRPAISRLLQMERRFKRDSTLQRAYTEFMIEYEQLGHMKLISPTNDSQEQSKTCYLPHHAVTKASSTTTKVRVVFDASCLTSSGASLNSNLMVGPTIQPDLTTILLRWRTNPVAFCADVEKMYRQILVHPDDQDFQRIIWRASPDLPIRHYRLTTVTYGTAAAPYLAVRSLIQIARDEEHRFPQAAHAVHNNFYVDDVMTGADNIETALELQSQLISLLETGGMTLRKWSSNDIRLLDNIPTEAQEYQRSLSPNEANNIHTLGILWDPTVDELGFAVHHTPATSTNLTKRQLLSEASRLFDPLGWLAPTTLIPKLLFQKLWLLHLNWDDNLPDNICDSWLKYHQQLPALAEIKLPRYTPMCKTDTIELHGFCDASTVAYSAVLYIRQIDKENNVSISLIRAKTRVAPIKHISLPRLELCGAALLASLISETSESLQLDKNVTIHFWCDSKVTLAWLQSPPSKWKVFIANRTSLILEKVPNAQFHYVRSAENPADIATRGIQPNKLQQQTLWWAGPTWLRHPVLPITELAPTANEYLDEARPTVSSFMVVTAQTWLPIEKFSTLRKIQRVTAYCLRFVNNTRQPKDARLTSHLTVKELNDALEFCVKQIQATSFSSEIQQLKREKTVSKKSQLHCLNPFLDQRNVIRVGGRLAHADLRYDSRHPIILPKNNHLTTVIVQDAHNHTLHGGVQLTLSDTRQSYWIINGRRITKSVIQNCIVCARLRAQQRHQIMADLPPHRTQSQKPFLHTAIDYAGPIILRLARGRGQRQVRKGYICVFICLSTKAIHLEAVSELTSESFLAALRRFIARRGPCTDIYSDCGTNFIGANNMLKEAYDIMIEAQPHLTHLFITWHFSPPSSPHFNGLAEAAVKSTKHHLRRVVGNEKLTREEFDTVLSQIEACLNSRPLCTLTDEPFQFEILTPGHFLVGCAPIAISESKPMDKECVQNKWKHLTKLVHDFWQRWADEYLQELQKRHKWTQPTPEPSIGDVVLLRDEQAPPLRWPMARISALHPGADGHVRVVTIVTAKGEFKRHIVKLVWLPTKDPEKMT